MFLDVADLELHVVREGPERAPVVLMLHSLGTSLAIWDHQAAGLAGKYHVIRPDMRGHGRTTVTRGATTIERLAQDALGVLDALGIEHAHVAGISIGGLIAQEMARVAPGRTRSLMLVDTALSLPPAEGWRDRATAVRADGIAPLADMILSRWFTAPFLTSADAVAVREQLLRTAPEGYASCAAAIADADFAVSSRAIACPALVVVGDQDLATPIASSEALHDAIAGSALVILRDAAHIPTVERPDAVLAAMRSFLEGIGE